jgi:hypothetical protein
MEIAASCKERNMQCIKGVQGTSATFNNSSVISQLTNAILAQNKEANESNRLRHKEINCIISKDEAKKDRTKKIHTSIIKMLGHVSAKSSTDKSETLTLTCTCFLNSENVGMAQYELIHQCKELGFPDICFAQGIAQALYVSIFLYTNSSTPSNFTFFAFHEQELLSDLCQNDYLICHYL